MGLIIDTSELGAFSARIGALKDRKDDFFKSACKTLGADFLGAVIPRTPVGSTGQLRRGWSAEGMQEGGGGGSYEITIINPTHYASYVNYGHRQTPGRFVPAIGKRLVASWVAGQFFVEGAEGDLQGTVNGTLSGLLDAYLGGAF